MLEIKIHIKNKVLNNKEIILFVIQIIAKLNSNRKNEMIININDDDRIICMSSLTMNQTSQPNSIYSIYITHKKMR